MEISKSEYFKRQTTLAEIGEKGQTLLQEANVLVIGCGGLGSPIAIYLAASGIGNLHIVDFDLVSISNLHRQVFYKTSHIKVPKAEILAKEIKERAPYTNVTFSNNAVEKSSILKLVSNYDVVVDGTDDLHIKYLINDACVVAKKPLVYGSLYKFDGYVSIFNVLEQNGTYSCNLRDAFPKVASDIPNCEEAGTLNPIVGIIALMQVNEVVKYITKTGKLLTNQLLIYNTLQNSQFKMKLKKNNSINIQELFENSNYISEEGCKLENQEWTISKEEFQQKRLTNNVEIISVINNKNTEIPFQVDQKTPIISFNINNFSPDFSKEYVIVCNKGISSYTVTEKLKQKFPKLKVYSLVGGIEKF